jgi:hypothetical protein
MSTQRYSVTPQTINTLLAWIQSGEIAIPEIQRPFVWDATKVRNLMDSLYQGYPVGYLISWRNPSIRLKDGSMAAGKRILIDGQQRVTALMAAILGREVLTKDYETVRIKIAFNPIEERFEVCNPAIEKDVAWISDIGSLFVPGFKALDFNRAFCELNNGLDANAMFEHVDNVRKIIHNMVGIIDLAEDLDIETVTEIFIRVNSAGAALSQADFAMSKIASNDTYGGNQLRKAIDYFCHLAIAPEFHQRIANHDRVFAETDYFRQLTWLKDVNEDLYDPSYTDMLRVAFTSEFGRGRLQDLVALLSGRNFETKKFEEEIAEASFTKLKTGIMNFMNRTHFERLIMILRSAGFVDRSLIGGANAINFAYVVYLRGRIESIPSAELEQLVRKWYALSTLTGRYSGNPETSFDVDIRQIESNGLAQHVQTVVSATMGEGFWSGLLPQQMDTSSGQSPYFACFRAAQVKMEDKGFLSRDILVRDLITIRSDIHHIYPKNYLKSKLQLSRGQYNQIANYVVTQSEINVAISDKPPVRYFAELAEQIRGGTSRYGGIDQADEMRKNLEAHCIPLSMMEGQIPEYDDFLRQRRVLMAQKLKAWFERL